MGNDLRELHKKVQEKLDKRPIENTYRNAWYIDARSSRYNEEVLEKLSDALRFDTVSWLIQNGYELADVPKLFVDQFDYRNVYGVMLEVQAIKEQREFPIGLRMLLMLLRQNKTLESNIAELQEELKQVRTATPQPEPRELTIEECLDRIRELTGPELEDD